MAATNRAAERKPSRSSVRTGTKNPAQEFQSSDRQGDGMAEPFGEDFRNEGAADAAVSVLEGVDRLEVRMLEGGLEGDVGRLLGRGVPNGDEPFDLVRDALRRRRLKARLHLAEAVNAHDAHGVAAEFAGADAAGVACEKRSVPFAQKRGRERGVPVLPHGQHHPGRALGRGIARGGERDAGDAQRTADGGHHDGRVHLDALDGARRDGLGGQRLGDDERILRLAQRLFRRPDKLHSLGLNLQTFSNMYQGSYP